MNWAWSAIQSTCFVFKALGRDVGLGPSLAAGGERCQLASPFWHASHPHFTPLALPGCRRRAAEAAAGRAWRRRGAGPRGRGHAAVPRRPSPAEGVDEGGAGGPCALSAHVPGVLRALLVHILTCVLNRGWGATCSSCACSRCVVSSSCACSNVCINQGLGGHVLILRMFQVYDETGAWGATCSFGACSSCAPPPCASALKS